MLLNKKPHDILRYRFVKPTRSHVCIDYLVAKLLRTVNLAIEEYPHHQGEHPQVLDDVVDSPVLLSRPNLHG